MKKQAGTTTPATQPRRRMHQADQQLADLRLQVLRAARQRCEDLGDGPEARQEMKRDVLDTPPELLADLLQALAEPIDRALLASAAPIPTTTTTEKE